MVEFPNVEECNYFTKRALENEKNEKTGQIVMWRRKGSETFHFVMKCPYCSAEQERDEKFEARPYRPICQKCGKSVTIGRILKKKAKAKTED